MCWGHQNLFVTCIARFDIAGFLSTYVTENNCNSAGLSNVVCYNGFFIMVGFVIAGCHCIVMLQIHTHTPLRYMYCSAKTHLL